jgi:hypothetical protein
MVEPVSSYTRAVIFSFKKDYIHFSSPPGECARFVAKEVKSFIFGSFHQGKEQ